MTDEGKVTWEAVAVTLEGDLVYATQVHTGVHATASVGKLWLLAEVAERLSQGTLDAERPLERATAACVADSGLWQHLRVETLGVHDAALLVAAVSDNLATNALLDVVPLSSVAERAQCLGATVSRLHDRVRDERGDLDPPALSTGVAAELAEAARRIHVAALGVEGLGLSPAAARLLEGWLRTGVDTSMVLDPMLLDPLAHDEGDLGIIAWSKTGHDRGVRADVGVVSGPTQTVAYAAVAVWDQGDEVQQRGEARRLMRELGGVIARRA